MSFGYTIVFKRSLLTFPACCALLFGLSSNKWYEFVVQIVIPRRKTIPINIFIVEIQKKNKKTLRMKKISSVWKSIENCLTMCPYLSYVYIVCISSSVRDRDRFTRFYWSVQRDKQLNIIPNSCKSDDYFIVPPPAFRKHKKYWHWKLSYCNLFFQFCCC